MFTRILEYLGSLPEWLKGVFVWAIGPLDMQLSYLALAIFCDLVLAVWVTTKEGTFKFSIMIRKTVEKLAIYTMILAIFNALGMVSNFPAPIRWGVLMALIVRDTSSFIKNVGRLGYGSLAQSLEEVFHKITHKDEEDDGQDVEKES